MKCFLEFKRSPVADEQKKLKTFARRQQAKRLCILETHEIFNRDIIRKSRYEFDVPIVGR